MWTLDDNAPLHTLTRAITRRTCYQLQLRPEGWLLLRLDYDQDRARLAEVKGFEASPTTDEVTVCALADDWIDMT